MSGLLLAVVQLRRLDALWTTTYGLILCGKLVAVCALARVRGDQSMAHAASDRRRRGIGPAARPVDPGRTRYRRGDPRSRGLLAIYTAAALAARRRRATGPCPYPHREGDGRSANRARWRRRPADYDQSARWRVPSASCERSPARPVQARSRDRTAAFGGHPRGRRRLGGSTACGCPFPAAGTLVSKSSSATSKKLQLRTRSTFGEFRGMATLGIRDRGSRQQTRP